MSETVSGQVRFVCSPEDAPTSEPIPMDEVPLLGREDRLGAYRQWTSHTCDGENEKHRACEVVFLQSAYKKVVDHLSRDTTREHGGFLLGFLSVLPASQRPAVVVTDAIAANHTEGTPVRLTFTNATWRDVDDQISEKYTTLVRAPERVGWYHSHPNISIFLSRWDLDVCTTYERREHPVALVVDPVIRRGGFFVGRANGYDAHEPQGFWEVHDLGQGSVVDWVNTKAASPQAQDVVEPEKTKPEVADLGPASSGAAVSSQLQPATPRGHASVNAWTTGPAALAMISLVALTCLAVFEHIDRSRIRILSDQVGKLEADMRGMQPRSQPAADLKDVPKAVVVEAKSAGPAKTDAVLKVSVNPAAARVHPAESVQFKAVVGGTKADQEKGVRWTLGPSSEGKITQVGKYTADAKPSRGNVTVIATSNADPRQSARVTVTVLLPAQSPPGGPAAGVGEPAKQSQSGGTDHKTDGTEQGKNGAASDAGKPADKQVPPPQGDLKKQESPADNPDPPGEQ